MLCSHSRLRSAVRWVYVSCLHSRPRFAVRWVYVLYVLMRVLESSGLSVGLVSSLMAEFLLSSLQLMKISVILLMLVAGFSLWSIQHEKALL